MQELRLYKSPGRAVRLILLCSIFVVPSALLLLYDDRAPWQLWLGIAFFGLGYPLGLYQLLDKRPQIIINEVGVFDRTAHQEFINWEIIQDVYLAKMHNQHFICLVVDEAFEPSRTKSAWKRGLAQLNKDMGFQELNINLAYIKVDAQRLAEFIALMRTAEKPERTFLVEKAIANL
jgi:hypothetical protein